MLCNVAPLHTSRLTLPSLHLWQHLSSTVLTPGSQKHLFPSGIEDRIENRTVNRTAAVAEGRAWQREHPPGFFDVTRFRGFGGFWTVFGALPTRFLGGFSQQHQKKNTLRFHCFGPVFGRCRPTQAQTFGPARLFGQKQRVTVGQRGQTVILKPGIKTLVTTMI